MCSKSEFIFFIKQKTAYEMRISDWSSDVCSSDLARKWDRWEKGDGAGDPPKRDLQLETLAGVLTGEILVQNHCYRADEMANMIDISREFGFKIRTFHHANEAYKIAPLLAKEDICVATWASWWGYKMEVFDAIEENAALVHAAGGCAIIHSDDPIVIQRLNQEAAAALSAAWRADIQISKADAEIGRASCRERVWQYV